MERRETTAEQMAACQAMRRWLEIRRKWRPEWPEVPSEADVAKSALLRRLLRGLEPLDHPPPTALSYPFHALVDQPGPHAVTWGAEGPAFFEREMRVMGTPGRARPKAAAEVVVLQHRYAVVVRLGDDDYVVRDAARETPYRFRLWRDPDHAGPAPAGGAAVRGAWLMRSMAFDEAGAAVPGAAEAGA